MHEVAARHTTSIAAIATRWVLDRDAVSAVMIGVRSDAHLEDNLGVFHLRLDDEDLARIESVVARAEGPHGDPFDLERRPDSPHATIMWTDLNRQRDPGSSA